MWERGYVYSYLIDAVTESNTAPAATGSTRQELGRSGEMSQ